MRITPRRRARELMVQGLYEWLLARSTPAVILKHLKEFDGYEAADAEFVKAGLQGVIKASESLQARLAPLADRKWAEVSPVERAILLLGAWELEHCPETPYRVIINESIELAKRYGGTDGHKYVNGILDRVALDVRADEVAAKRARTA